MPARTDTYKLMHDVFQRFNTSLNFEDANTLRRAQITLHRWAELECGDGNDFASWAIERDETTEKPYLCTYPHTGAARKRHIADKERGALKRVADVCQRNALYFYHQGDPRGCALYISNEPIKGHDYTRGIACC